MSDVLITLAIIGGIIIGIPLLYVILTYNRFVSYTNQVAQSLAGIDVQLKRRTDLIPNLVTVVKGYAKHESDVLTKVTQLRTKMYETQDVAKKNKLDLELESSLKSLFAVAENYPNLQANTHFTELQKELANTENEIAASRRIFNENVTVYNTMCESFPSNIIAKLFTFTKKHLLEL